ncbi:cyclic nucleotide-gated ion channel 1-like [Prunus avium]|uniref:Cyclic nucleotide-gated ion channel 1-like n=1 Tax=Prunus avium TaxID=42229 RepID=A0A6P5S168_PRUAV|nr:cyclic nucleotide-gated ion channel 1-like [Prunus avium]
MSNPVGQVSIKLSNLDEEGESSKLKEDGGHRSPSTVAAKRPKLEEVVINAYHPQPKIFLPKWEIIFTVASAFAVFVDPFCCYVPVIIDHSTSYTWDETLLWTIFALRSAGDQFYGMDILVFIKRRRDNVNAKPFGASWTKYFGGPDSTIRKVLNGQKSLRFLGIVPRICAALPILQAFLVVGLKTDLVRLYQQLLYLIAFQYILRAYNFYRWLDQHANIETAVKRFLKAALDFLPFILAAHLFGALWYYFAVDQKIAYWEEHCRKFDGACSDYVDPFYCSNTLNHTFNFNVSRLHESCAVQLSANVTSLPFDFGIYLSALQSNMTSSRDLPVKMLQCIWWGLRNLSSFGSNLQTSFFKDEIIFSIVISISGLALFLVYLNSRVPGSKKVSDQLKLQQKIETVYPDIIEQMHNMCRLSLASLKKVPLLESTDDKVLKAICEYLKPVTYGEDVYIIREGEPLRKMFFITRGTALTYTTTKGGTTLCKCLEKSDFYGEELLNWAFKFSSFSKLPISTTTLLSQTKVEAFSIRAHHLKSIVAPFWWHFQRELPRSQLEHFAASSIHVDTVAYHLSVLREMFPNGINLLSLFSGIGGAEIALHWLGIPLKNVMSVEKYAVNRSVVRSWWEQTNQRGNLYDLEDVQQLNGDSLEHYMNLFGGTVGVHVTI